jgi:hypothetical protein
MNLLDVMNKNYDVIRTRLNEKEQELDQLKKEKK